MIARQTASSRCRVADGASRGLDARVRGTSAQNTVAPPSEKMSQLAMLFSRRRYYLLDMDQETRDYFEKLAAMLAREFERISGRFDGVDGRLDKVEGRLDAIEGRLDGVEGRLEGHDRRLDRLEATVLDLRREMRSGFAEVRVSIDALTVRVEALEQGV
jgi:hypothetical protein